MMQMLLTVVSEFDVSVLSRRMLCVCVCVCVCVCACVCSTSTMSVLHRELFKHLSVLRLIQSKHVSTSAGNKTIHLDHPVLLFTELEVGFTVILILIFVYLLRLHYFLSLLCCYCCTSAC